MDKPFIWDQATPLERAQSIRQLARLVSFERRRAFSSQEICTLYDLTPQGAAAIISGADWRPEYSQSIENARPVLLAYAVQCAERGVKPFADKELSCTENEAWKTLEAAGLVEFIAGNDGGRWIVTDQGRQAADSPAPGAAPAQA